MTMEWSVLLDTSFAPEFSALSASVQDELLAHVKLLEKFGPHLGRPRADTLKGSRHANMKELRFDADDGAWPSPLIPSAGRSCLSPGIRAEGAKSTLTGG